MLKVREQGVKRFRTGIQISRAPAKEQLSTGQMCTVKQRHHVVSGVNTTGSCNLISPEKNHPKKKKLELKSLLVSTQLFFAE